MILCILQFFSIETVSSLKIEQDYVRDWSQVKILPKAINALSGSGIRKVQNRDRDQSICGWAQSYFAGNCPGYQQ